MTRQEILDLKDIKPKKDKDATARLIGDDLIIDFYISGHHYSRYHMVVSSGKYETYFYKSRTYAEPKWKMCKFVEAIGKSYYEYFYTNLSSEVNMTKKEECLISDVMSSVFKSRAWHYNGISWYSAIGDAEFEFSCTKRAKYEQNRLRKVNDLMQSIPPVPSDAAEFMYGVAAAEKYAFRIKDIKDSYGCSHCGRKIRRKNIKNGSRLVCPKCKSELTVVTRTDHKTISTGMSLIQDIDAGHSVLRQFKVRIDMTAAGHGVYADEAIRVVLLRGNPKYYCMCYYNQYCTNYSKRGFIEASNHSFDKHNPANRRMGATYLYPSDISPALKGTDFEGAAKIIELPLKDGRELDYNQLLWIAENEKSKNIYGVLEYLYKGKFFKLFSELINCRTCAGHVGGPLDFNGSDIDRIFEINDRQKINRIRDIDGNVATVEWMQYSDRKNARISDKALKWLTENDIQPNEIEDITQMTVEQIVNYIQRQNSEQYKNMKASSVLDQYKDYISMCKKLKKDVSDALTYRPKELKRRHDEAAAEINAIRIAEELKHNRAAARKAATELKKKFPEAENNLKKMKPKLDYKSGEFVISTPTKLTDITAEGMALHHCVGASDRYFDRIEQNETYITFLRRASDPKTPYYTIEVEPGGTIRQHRSMYDDEPGIDEIKPFLREWQQAIKKRISEDDKKNALISKCKRLKNDEDLRNAGNMRVIKGLEEDFLDAEAI